MMPASSRGATRYFIGLVDSVDSASIWSVTRMVPISAAMAAPMRPATIRPASTGPSSRVIDSTTTIGDRALGGEAGEAGIGLQRQHHAGEDRGQRHHRQAEIADLQQGAREQAAVERRADQMRQAECREQRQRTGHAARADDAAADARRDCPAAGSRGEIDPVEAAAERRQHLVAVGAGRRGHVVGRLVRADQLEPGAGHEAGDDRSRRMWSGPWRHALPAAPGCRQRTPCRGRTGCGARPSA